MLQAIRDQLVGWVAWGIVILISVPFIVMGVTDFGSPAAVTVVAEIDDETIAQSDYQNSFQMRRQAIQRQLGGNYRADIFDPRIRQKVLDTMVEEKLLTVLMDKHKVQVGDEELSTIIRADKEFMQAGKFNYQFYTSKLSQSGFTTETYERYLRSDRQLNSIPRLIRESSFITHEEAQRYYQLLNQTRDFDYILIGKDQISADIEVTDEEAKIFYDKNKALYVRPEQVKIEYVQLSAKSLIAGVDATEENIHRFYEENAEDFIVDEQRKASHILLPLAEGKSLQESPDIIAKLDEIQTSLKSGAAFAELAKKYSADTGSAQQGGDLGQVLRGVMVPPFEEALFSMTQAGQISDPVRTSFGIHLIRLDEITPRQVKSFEDVKEVLKQDFAAKQAVELYYDQSERLAEIAYENPDSLTPVAEVLDLEVKTSDWIALDNDAPGVEGNKDVLRAAFNERLKTEMTNSDPVEVGENDVVIVRVTDSRAASQYTFEEVAEQVRATARGAVIGEKVHEYANALLEKIQAGTSLKQLAKNEKLTVEEKTNTARQGGGLPAELSRGIFSLPALDDDKPRAETIKLANNTVALVLLKHITVPDISQMSDANSPSLSRGAVHEAQMLLSDLRQKATVVIHKDKL